VFCGLQIEDDRITMSETVDEKTSWEISHFTNLRKLVKKGLHGKAVEECNKSKYGRGTRS